MYEKIMKCKLNVDKNANILIKTDNVQKKAEWYHYRTYFQ